MSEHTKRIGNKVGWFLACLTLIILLPLFLMLLSFNGDCAGAPKPCTASRWSILVLTFSLVLLCAGTAWATRKLRSGDQDWLSWVAFYLAAALVALAVVVGPFSLVFWFGL